LTSGASLSLLDASVRYQKSGQRLRKKEEREGPTPDFRLHLFPPLPKGGKAPWISALTSTRKKEKEEKKRKGGRRRRAPVPCCCLHLHQKIEKKKRGEGGKREEKSLRNRPPPPSLPFGRKRRKKGGKEISSTFSHYGGYGRSLRL